MQLVLTQPLCILFPQSLNGLISGNTSHSMSANSLILFVRLWWSALRAEVSGGLFWGNEDAHGAGWILCFWTNLFNAVAIFIDTYAGHDGHLIYLLHPTSSKEDSDIIIHRPSSPTIEVLKTSLDAGICRLGHTPVFIPAVCTTHCPFVSSPPPSDSPAAAGCFASALGCSHKL